jgi:hypothetical protein
MDGDIIEAVAIAIQRQYHKETTGEILKWEKRPGGERSTWRLVARAAIQAIELASPMKAPVSSRRKARKPRNASTAAALPS